MLLCCCIKRSYVYLVAKSSSQMTNRFKYDLLCCQYNYLTIYMTTFLLLPLLGILFEVLRMVGFFQPSFLEHYNWPGLPKKSQYFPSLQIRVFHYNWLFFVFWHITIGLGPQKKWQLFLSLQKRVFLCIKRGTSQNISNCPSHSIC